MHIVLKVNSCQSGWGLPQLWLDAIRQLNCFFCCCFLFLSDGNLSVLIPVIFKCFPRMIWQRNVQRLFTWQENVHRDCSLLCLHGHGQVPLTYRLCPWSQTNSYLALIDNTVFLPFHCFNCAVYLHKMDMEVQKTKVWCQPNWLKPILIESLLLEQSLFFLLTVYSLANVLQPHQVIFLLFVFFC